MGRKQKEITKLMRVRFADLERLKAIARSLKLSLPDYIAMMSRRK